MRLPQTRISNPTPTTDTLNRYSSTPAFVVLLAGGTIVIVARDGAQETRQVEGLFFCFHQSPYMGVSEIRGTIPYFGVPIRRILLYIRSPIFGNFYMRPD